MAGNYSLMIHGGAGELDHIRNSKVADDCLESIREILDRGGKLLKRGGTALDAVETCASMLEDNSLFNAGCGAVLNENGEVELDAAIMDGKDLNAGATAGLTRVRNPVQLARAILDRSEHVMLIGDGAIKFARQHHIKLVRPAYFITEKRVEEYNSLLKKGKIRKNKKHGTIGAVARDKNGNLAAATSTGGLAGKKAGRVGDSPVIGAGVYADNNVCAISATGHGEMFMRTVLAKYIADLIETRKLDPAKAVKQGITYLKKKVNGYGGVIVIDKKGRCFSDFNTRTMIHGWIEHGGNITCTFK